MHLLICRCTKICLFQGEKKKTLEEDLSIALDLKSVYSGEIDQCGFVRIQ